MTPDAHVCAVFFCWHSETTHQLIHSSPMKHALAVVIMYVQLTIAKLSLPVLSDDGWRRVECFQSSYLPANRAYDACFGVADATKLMNTTTEFRDEFYIKYAALSDDRVRDITDRTLLVKGARRRLQDGCIRRRRLDDDVLKVHRARMLQLRPKPGGCDDGGGGGEPHQSSLLLPQ